jgi:hypothetical protein
MAIRLKRKKLLMQDGVKIKSDTIARRVYIKVSKTGLFESIFLTEI